MKNINSYKTSATASARVVRATIENTTSTFSAKESYGTVLPTNIDVFSGLTQKVTGLDNSEVALQVKQVILCLYLSLQKAHRKKSLSNYLSRINIVQQEDKAALLEWSFQDFRVGFTLEPEKSESGYFVVSQDKSAGSFMTDTQKLDDNISRTVDSIVEYVLENT